MVVIFIGWATALPTAADAAEGYLSPLAIETDHAGQRFYVAEVTAHQVAEIDRTSGHVTRRFPLPAAPGGLALSDDDARLYVTTAAPAGQVLVLDLAGGTIVRTHEVGHTPMAPVLSADGTRLYVCNRFDNNVQCLDLASGQSLGIIAVPREPVAMAMTPDGRRLFVANHLPSGPATAAHVAAVVSVIDLQTNRIETQLPLPNGSTGLRGLCLSPDGRFAYVTHTLGRYQLPTTQIERGWMNTNALTVIDALVPQVVNTVLLDDVDQGAANPWGVACSPDGRYLCVAQAGTHELSVIDRSALHERLTLAAAGQRVNAVTARAADVPNDLSFLQGVRRRVALGGNGPRGVAVTGDRAIVTQYFSDSLAEVALAPSNAAVVRTLALGPAPQWSEERKGEVFFNDASLCLQQWQSCASCHPDVRSDGLNWDLLNDGIGNPKNDKSLLLAHATPPAMSLGVRDSAEKAVRAGIRYIQFAVRPEADAVAIDRFLKALQPVQSPHRTRVGQLTEAATRGEALFTQTGCANCHAGPALTLLQIADVGTGNARESNFDTPTLVEVWRTAPYLHAGQAATIMDVLTTFNAQDQHGVTGNLSTEELNDLAEYVLSQ